MVVCCDVIFDGAYMCTMEGTCVATKGWKEMGVVNCIALSLMDVLCV